MTRLDRRRFITSAGAISGASLSAAPLAAMFSARPATTDCPLRATSLRCVSLDLPVESAGAHLSPTDQAQRADQLAAEVAALCASEAALDLVLLPALPNFTEGGSGPWLASLRSAARHAGVGIVLADATRGGAMMIEPEGALRTLRMLAPARAPTQQDVVATAFGNWLCLAATPDAAMQHALSSAGVECILLPPLAELPLRVHAPLALLTPARGAPLLPPGCPNIWAGLQHLRCSITTAARNTSMAEHADLPIAALRRARLAA